MDTILAHAHALVYALMQLMPSAYQQESLRVMLGLFLEAQGAPLPAHSRAKSASALSRFLNQYDWSTRARDSRRSTPSITAATSSSLARASPLATSDHRPDDVRKTRQVQSL